MVRTPMRYQCSYYDCVQTCWVNSISRLWDLDAIPPTVIHHIHLYGYDVVGKGNRLGCGTTAMSIQLVAQWLESYRTEKFQVETEFLEEDEVHLGKGNAIDACLEEGGLVLCRVRMNWFWHYVLAIDADKERLFFFDPMLRKRIQGYSGRVELLESDGYGPNLSITRAWLDRQCDKKSRFCFGPTDEREALLMWRLT